MYKEKRIGVVIPSYNEEKLIGRTIEGVPEIADVIIVVDDQSKDRTVNIVKDYQNRLGKEKLILIQHKKNSGVGASISTGYKYARDNNIDVTVVMAGDAQMDPNDFTIIIEPVVTGRADYSKGNRLFSGQSWKIIPKLRYLGNSSLSLLTKIVSGYWSVADSQCGYTAISLKMLKRLNLDNVYKRYGCPNDILVKLNVNNAKICDVPIRPVYNIGEKSGIKLSRVLFTISFLLLKLFFWRLKEKYIIRDFHPLVFFYFSAIFLYLLGLGMGVTFIWKFFTHDFVSVPSIIISTFCIINAVQMSLFAMWFDMSNNKDLNV